MKLIIKQITESEHSYRIRWMTCVAIVEALMLAVVLLWPVSDKQEVYQDLVFSDNEIFMEQVQITTQQSSPPSPPKPQIPVPVPNDQVIEEDILIFEDINLSEYTDPQSLQGPGPADGTGRVTANPQTPPNLIRIVEPTVPEAAKKEGIKAEIWVSFLVNTEGNVEEATIAQIKLYEGKEEFRYTKTIGYGLVEATLKAALQWKFRPAKDNGSPVKAYTKHIFTYGF